MLLDRDSPASSTDHPATSSIHGLLPQLRNLIDRAENARQTVLNEADTLIEELKEAHRALSIITHLDDRYVIAVTGPQGTGKTTMMQSLYGIPDEYLKVNPGVGEKLPILIVEHSEDNFDAAVHRYEAGEVQRETIEASECRKIASGPGADDVMIELRVPGQFFGSEDRGFLLLPGSEEISTSYTELVDHVLPCASTAIVCVDDTSMAQEHTRKEIERLRADLERAKELYALTKANQSNDNNEELRGRLCPYSCVKVLAR